MPVGVTKGPRLSGTHSERVPEAQALFPQQNRLCFLQFSLSVILIVDSQWRSGNIKKKNSKNNSSGLDDTLQDKIILVRLLLSLICLDLIYKVNFIIGL